MAKAASKKNTSSIKPAKAAAKPTRPVVKAGAKSVKPAAGKLKSLLAKVAGAVRGVAIKPAAATAKASAKKSAGKSTAKPKPTAKSPPKGKPQAKAPPKSKPKVQPKSKPQPRPKAKTLSKAQTKPKVAAGAKPKAAVKPSPTAKGKVTSGKAPATQPKATSAKATTRQATAPKSKDGPSAAPKAGIKPAPQASAVVAQVAIAPASKPSGKGRGKSAKGVNGGKGAVSVEVRPQPVAPVKRSPPKGRIAVAVPVAPDRLNRNEPAPLLPVKMKKGEVVRPKLPPNYRPTANEVYMNPLQVEYFRQKLFSWRTELVEESKQTIDNLRDEVRDVGDDAERATRETENSLELRTRDRYRKLLSKIDKALKRIDDGEYGWCEETGEEIGLERLEVRPIATLCLDAQERWEIRQRQLGD